MAELNTLRKAINMIPGKVNGAAAACDVSIRAVYKWINSGRLPRTDYTGETEYAQKLADASGSAFTAAWLLDATLKDSNDQKAAA